MFEQPEHQPFTATRLTLVSRCFPLLDINVIRILATLALPAFALCACRPVAPLATIRKQSPPAPPSEPVVSVASIPPVPPTPSSPAKPPTLTRVSVHGIHFEGVCFDARSHRLQVIDQPNGPASTFSSSQDAARRYGSLLAINAGFFTPEGKPLGLVISKGVRSGAWNSASSLGSGIFSESATGQLTLSRRRSPSTFSTARELVQAGPLLVENGKTVSGLDTEKSAVRSILLTDSRNLWWIGKTSSCSLAALGTALASQTPVPWTVFHALNLDGGRSTDLFVSAQIHGGPLERRSILNRPVRNFLILKPR